MPKDPHSPASVVDMGTASFTHGVLLLTVLRVDLE